MTSEPEHIYSILDEVHDRYDADDQYNDGVDWDQNDITLELRSAYSCLQYLPAADEERDLLLDLAAILVARIATLDTEDDR